MPDWKFDEWGWSGELCNHPECSVVDEWDETESDPYRLRDQTIHCVKFECHDCYKTWIETTE